MTAAVMETPRFDMGRVVGRMFGSIGRNLVVFGLLTLLLAGVPEAIALPGELMTIGLGAHAAGAPLSGAFGSALYAGLLQLVGIILRVIGVYVLQAALIHGVVVDLNGKRASFGDCLSTGFGFFWPVLGIAILTVLGVACGLILLIVPGIMLAMAWLVNVPAEVVERKGVFGSFGRSADLTRNHRWAIFGLLVLYLIAVWIVSLAALALAGGLSVFAFRQGVAAPVLIVTTLLRLIESLIGATGVASIYYELRSIKEGVGPETLAAVFD